VFTPGVRPTLQDSGVLSLGISRPKREPNHMLHRVARSIVHLLLLPRQLYVLTTRCLARGSVLYCKSNMQPTEEDTGLVYSDCSSLTAVFIYFRTDFRPSWPEPRVSPQCRPRRGDPGSIPPQTATDPLPCENTGDLCKKRDIQHSTPVPVSQYFIANWSQKNWWFWFVNCGDSKTVCPNSLWFPSVPPLP
jgi:hypothetical protein